MQSPLFPDLDPPPAPTRPLRIKDLPTGRQTVLKRLITQQAKAALSEAAHHELTHT